MRTLTALLLLFGSVHTAGAAEFRPLQGQSIALDRLDGIAYFTRSGDGYDLVTTLAAGDNSLPVRFSLRLAEGQTLTISVPGKQGGRGRAVEISRVGEKVVVIDASPAGDTDLVAGH